MNSLKWHIVLCENVCKLHTITFEIL